MKTPTKTIIITVILIIILVVTLTFIFWPAIKEIKNISEKIYQERFELEKKYLAGQNLKKSVADYEKVKGHLEELETIFVKKEEELKFITSLENLAEKNQIEQKIILNIQKEETKNLSKTIPIQLNLRGNYLNLLEYLRDLEVLNYYINLKNVSFIKSDSKSSSALIKIQEPFWGGKTDLIEANLSGEIYQKGTINFNY